MEGAEAMSIVLEGLRDPLGTRDWPNRRWDAFVRIARNQNLLARFALHARELDLVDQIPEKVQDLLVAAQHVATHHRRIVEWESRCLRQILSYHGIEFILLKGAAYIMGELPAGRGRKVSDIDILVRKEDLEHTEQILLHAGWAHTKLNPYDQRYYRRWMHELPPLKHRDRKTLVDVHHTILPESGRLHPDPHLLWQGARRRGAGDWLVLAPEDMVLHSAAHLFQDGDLNGGLRDLFDMDDLMRNFADQDPDFWERLIPRAEALDLARPTYYALYFCHDLLGTRIPDFVLTRAAAHAPCRPIRDAMRFLGKRTLVPTSPDGRMRPYQWERVVLYMRAHWLRMPPLLLARHLSHKFFLRSKKE